jgi:hypothetical protein
MTQALKDSNSVSSLTAVLNTDTVQGTNLVRIAVDSTTNGVLIDTTSTISFTMQSIDPRDQNYVGVWCFQGTSDGLLYPAVATASGKLLVNLT